MIRDDTWRRVRDEIDHAPGFVEGLIEVHPHKLVGSWDWTDVESWLLDYGIGCEVINRRENVFHAAISPVGEHSQDELETGGDR